MFIKHYNQSVQNVFIKHYTHYNQLVLHTLQSISTECVYQALHALQSISTECVYQALHTNKNKVLLSGIVNTYMYMPNTNSESLFI